MPRAEATVAPSGLNRENALAAGRAFLRRAGVEAAEDDARLLLLDACAIERLALVTGAHVAISPEQARRYQSFLDRRAGGEPVSRILGRRAFWTLDLEVRPGVLDPRGDTEALVRLALRVAGGHGAPRRILDLGCGSGAILCALLSEFEAACGLGVDLSAVACAAAAANIGRCGFSGRARIARGNWGEGVSGPFDLIVSNPPYIPGGEIAGLDREVRDHDPRLSLDGGPDGLDAYRAIFAAAPSLLAPGAAIVVEFGFGQAEDVESLAFASGLKKVDGEQDLGGRDRAAAFTTT